MSSDDDGKILLSPRALAQTSALLRGASAGGVTDTAAELWTPQTEERVPLPQIKTHRVTLIDCAKCGVVGVVDKPQVQSAIDTHRDYHRTHNSKMDHWLQEARSLRTKGNPPQSSKAVVDWLATHWEGHKCTLAECPEVVSFMQTVPEELQFQASVSIELLDSYTAEFNKQLDALFSGSSGILLEP